ncbi:MAG: preprotein translocase subunit SecY [Chloroflexi bacterium]|nr:preprotein translocase subunit SecY [Chloroflexota bacterium]
MLQAGIDAFQQTEVRQKVLFTLALLLVFRAVAHIPVPGVDVEQLRETFDNNAILGFLNVFSGGALRNLSVAALGVYPYITASIIMQLAGGLVPRVAALQKEGESGRQRLQIYTHWLTVPFAALQGYAQLLLIQQLGGVTGVGFGADTALPTVASLFSMVAGTMFLVWLGELLTEKGIGNGISLIIFGGIVAGMPELLGGVIGGGGLGFGRLVFLGLVTVAIVYVIVLVQEAQRRIPVQYARSTFRGGRMYRQQGQTHIPLRVNSAGMIPLIFAFSIMIFPPAFFQFVARTVDVGWIANIADFLQRTLSPTEPVYWLSVFLLVFIFTYFYTVVVFQQQNLAENLQRQGGFIPGMRPGRPTQEYLTRVLIRITAGGAFFLGIIAIVPFVTTRMFDVQSLQISAAGLLIVVGVVLDTMRQLEAQMLMRNYEGFIS